MNARLARGLVATCALASLAAPAPRAPVLKSPPPPPGKQLPTAFAPTKLVLSIGGAIFPPNYSITLDGDTLTYRVQDLDPKTQKVVVTSQAITPSAEQWGEFWKAMDEVGLWRWRPVYEAPHTFDGTHWSVEAAHGGHSVRSRGRILFPGQETTANRPDCGPVFEKYLAAVGKLLGGKTFR